MNLISVILPFYNAEKFLEKAVRSILNQSYTNFEILLVDDGSSDGSNCIAGALADSDCRIKLLKQQNQGVSAARNLGIKHITGDYLMFVDADDWVDPEMMLNIMKQLDKFKQVDLVRLTIQKVSNRESNQIQETQFVTKLFDPLTFINENLLGGYVASLFIKTAIVKKHNILFSEDMRFMEDQEFSLKCFLHAKQILYYNKKHYFYYENPQSISLSNIKNVTANSADMLKCASRVYNYALNVSSENMIRMIKNYALLKIKQYLKINISYQTKPSAIVKDELQQCLKDMGIAFYQIGINNLLFYLIIKTKLRFILTK